MPEIRDGVAEMSDARTSENTSSWPMYSVSDMRTNGELVPEPLGDRSYSGKFMVRVPPEVHRSLVIRAAEQGVSMNRLVSARLAREG